MNLKWLLSRLSIFMCIKKTYFTSYTENVDWTLNRKTPLIWNRWRPRCLREKQMCTLTTQMVQHWFVLKIWLIIINLKNKYPKKLYYIYECIDEKIHIQNYLHVNLKDYFDSLMYFESALGKCRVPLFFLFLTDILWYNVVVLIL